MKLDRQETIVMVDDDEGDRYIAKQSFSESRLCNPWIEFDLGEALLSHLSGVKEVKASMPALVLLDINTPMKGFEVLESLRGDPFFKNIPSILMFSHSDREEDAERADRIGANGFRQKPITIEDYVAFFNSLY